MVDDDDEMSKDKEIDKLMDLISLSFKKIYKQLHQTPVVQIRIILQGFTKMLGMKVKGVKPKRVKDAAYHQEKMLLCKQEEAGIQLNAEQADWKDDTDDESDDQELEAHYMYMAKLQQVSPDAIDTGPIFDKELEPKVFETYKNVPQEIRDQLNAEAEGKEIDKLMALISLSFKKIYKPTNNNLRTSSNTSRANQDNSSRIHRNAGYEGQRSGTVAGARDTVGSSMVQKSGIQCYNSKEYGHVARECQKPKRAKDATYHREKMLLCKQEEAGIQLNAEQADWKDDT
nr:hypothetical protein [Tanacetum cinerariifolium]